LNSDLPMVTIIVPAYNAGCTLQVCLTSLLRQDYPPEKFIVMVVNDGSTDETGALFHQMKLPENFALIEHAENRGLAATRNTGIQNTHGEILIFLDADMELASDFISRHVAHYEQSEVVGIVSELKPAPENPYDKYQRYIYESQRGARVIGANGPLPFQYFIFGLTSVKRSALELTSNFDAMIHDYGGEDTEMAYRLWQKYPAGLFFDPEIKVIHHHYRTLEQALKLVTQFGRNVVPYLIQKHPEMAKLYGAGYVRKRFPVANRRQNPFKLFAGLVLRQKAVSSCLRGLFVVMPFPLSNGIVRLLMASAILRGISINEKTNR